MTLDGGAPDQGLPPDRNRLALHPLPIFGCKAVAGGELIAHPFATEDERVIGLAQPRRRLDQRIQHRLQVECRAADHLEHVGGGGLLLQRLAEIVGARLHLVEQSHVLDRDHRLVGEGLEQFDLLRTEGPWFCADYDKSADDKSLAQKRHADSRPYSGSARLVRALEFRIGDDVRNVNGAAFDQRSPEDRSATRLRRVAFEMSALWWREAVGRRYGVGVAHMPADDRLVRLAKSHGQLRQRVEHRLQIEGRAADHLEHVGGGGLLLQRFAQLVEQAGVLDGDDGLVGESLQHRKLLVRERPGREAHDAERADRGIAAHHGHHRHRPVAARQEVPAAGREFERRVPDVGDVHDPGVENGGAVHVLARERKREPAPPRLGASGIRLGDGRGPHLVPVRERDADGGVGEELQPALHDGIEHRLRIVERVADDSQDLGGRASAAPAPRRARARVLRASFPAPTRMRACGRRALSSSFRWNECCDRPFAVSALCETLYEPKSPRRHGRSPHAGRPKLRLKSPDPRP